MSLYRILFLNVIFFIGNCSGYDYFVKTSVSPKTPVNKIAVIQENNNRWWSDHFSRGLFYTELMEYGFQIIEAGNQSSSSKENIPAKTNIFAPIPSGSIEQFIYDFEYIKKTGRDLGVDMILFIHVNHRGALTGNKTIVSDYGQPNGD
jgi:hypothetical protein